MESDEGRDHPTDEANNQIQDAVLLEVMIRKETKAGEAELGMNIGGGMTEAKEEETTTTIVTEGTIPPETRAQVGGMKMMIEEVLTTTLETHIEETVRTTDGTAAALDPTHAGPWTPIGSAKDHLQGITNPPSRNRRKRT